jgi:thiol-disulfide isomerase/thioredoxin
MSLPRRTVACLVSLLGSWGCSPRSIEPVRVPTTAGTAPKTAAPAVPPRVASPEAPQHGTAVGNGPSASPTTPAGTSEPTPPDTPDGLVEQAGKRVQSGDLAGAIRLLEQAIEARPDHRKALLELAVLNQERANELERPQSSPFYLRSASFIRKLRDVYKDLTPNERAVIPDLLYNEACTYAIQDQPAQALDSLADAIDAGLSRPDLLTEDDELDSVRDSPRFAELFQKVEQNARARALENARKILAGTTPFALQFSLPDLESKTVTLDDVKGKVTIVDIWGTWCPPCRREIPHFKALLEKYRDQGLAIVGINYENVAEADVKKTIKGFIKEHAIPYTCLIGDDTTQEQIPNFQGFPTTLFLDAKGMVRAVTIGYQSFVGLDAMVAILLDANSTNP